MKTSQQMLVCLWIVTFMTLPLAADTVAIEASKDNTLVEKNSGDLSNGAGDYFFAGNTDQSPGDRTRRGLIAFDISASVPAGSTITSVTLTLYMSRAKENMAFDIKLHRLLNDWGEGSSHADGEEEVIRAELSNELLMEKGLEGLFRGKEKQEK